MIYITYPNFGDTYRYAKFPFINRYYVRKYQNRKALRTTIKLCTLYISRNIIMCLIQRNMKKIFLKVNYALWATPIMTA